MRCVGYLIIGRGEKSDTTFTNLPDSVLQLEDRVIENCLTVQAAVEVFAAENGGIYPSNVGAEETRLGNTVIDLLPGGQHLKNPYTSFRTEPELPSNPCDFLPYYQHIKNYSYLAAKLL